VPAVERSWLAGDASVERLDLGSGAWVDVVRGLVTDADRVHEELVGQVQWRQGRVFRYERWLAEPRLGGWQSGPARHPALVAVQDWLRRRYRVPLEGVALARYRHGGDSLGLHRDRELRWLEDTLVAVLTLGARRPWVLAPVGAARRGFDDGSDVPAGAVDLGPSGGDLVVMGGRCQAAFQHGVPKVRDRAVGERISAQWRWTSRRGRPDLAPGYRAPRRYRS
jgi:alkylated DNA repair dioxygenase AlkB